MILHLLGPGSRPVHAAEAADAIAADEVPLPATATAPAAATARAKPDEASSARHRVVTLGPAAGAAARRAGLAVDAAIHPAGGPGQGGRIPLQARLTLRRRLPAAAGDQAPDAVVAWDAAALAAAASFLPAVPRVLRLSDPPDATALAWLVARMATAGFDAAAASEALAGALVRGGLPAGRVRVHTPVLREERLARGGSDGTDRLVFAVAGGPGVDARPLVLAAALGQEAGGRRITLRLSPACDRLPEALDVADATRTSTGDGPRVLQDPRMETPWAALADADALRAAAGRPRPRRPLGRARGRSPRARRRPRGAGPRRRRSRLHRPAPAAAGLGGGDGGGGEAAARAKKRERERVRKSALHAPGPRGPGRSSRRVA